MKKRVLIQLSGTRLRLAVLRGRSVVMSRGQLIVPGSDLDALTPLAREWLEGMRVSGCETTVVYESASVLASVQSCPLAAGLAGAASAARLALGEVAGFAPDDESFEIEALESDRPEASDARRHTLTAADRAGHVRNLAEWVRSLGLRPVSLVPATALALSRTVRAVRASPARSLRASLWLDEHYCVLAAGDGVSLRFVRTLNLGVSSMAEALMRPMRRADGGTVQLTRGEAYEVLEQCGIPAAEETVDAERGLVGASVLPLLQPVLQRLSVDVKQSLRFGLNEGERTGTTLTVDGPGGRLRRLAEVLGQLSGVAAHATGSVDGGFEPLWGEQERVSLNLLPKNLERELTAERARWSMRAGLAAAAALMGLYGGNAWVRLQAQGQSRAELQRQLANLEERNQLTGRAEEAARLAKAAEGRVSAELGSTVRAARVLAALSEAVPEGVALTGITLRGEGAEGPTALLEGVIDTGRAGEFSGALQRLCDGLAAVPLVRSAQVGTVRREESREGDRRRFELTVRMVGLPVRVADLTRVDGEEVAR